MTGWLAGRGIADITGEAAGCGMLGYGMADQVTEGIHTRRRSRAFVLADAVSGERVLLVVNDLPLIFSSVHAEVLARLAQRYGGLYTAHNVMITATHTHCGPGGYAHHLLYNTTTGGFRPATFQAIVDGIVEAAERAHADVAPAELTLAHGELRDASVNRSRSAFERNPLADKEFFPDAIDPQTTVLSIGRDGTLVGAITWFATHNTSMTNRNRLISSDNKGYAAYRWEREGHGVDYLAGDQPEFVAAFPQTNAGDMSPNLGLRPGHGPTDDEFENTRIIGTRQCEAAEKLAAGPGREVGGGVGALMSYVDLSDVPVSPEFTGDGQAHRTGRAVGGASALAGAWADGPAFPGFRPGRNPFWDGLSRAIYRYSARLRDAHAPKGMILPGGLLNRLHPFVAERAPVQLLRIGPLYLIGIPGEVTIVAGLRLRRTVAAIVGAEVRDVLVAGYTGGYLHYVTTPEEYDDQQYEGGSTLFGRWELAALCQSAATLAHALRDGRSAGTSEPPRPHRPLSFLPRPVPDLPPPGRRFGDVLTAPRETYASGRVIAEFVGAHPGNDLRRGGTHLEIQRRQGETWQRVADDGDWATRFRWSRNGRSSIARISWDIPAEAAAGHYRIRYHGEARGPRGERHPFHGTTAGFDVT